MQVLKHLQSPLSLANGKERLRWHQLVQAPNGGAILNSCNRILPDKTNSYFYSYFLHFTDGLYNSIHSYFSL